MATLPDWLSLPSQLESTFSSLNESLKLDEQLLAFSDTSELKKDITFGWKSAGSSDAIICTVSKAKAVLRTGGSDEADFILVAKADQWREFYQPIPMMPFQSYWGMFGQNIHQAGVEVEGNKDLFIQLTAIWRRVLEMSHEALHGPIQEDAQDALEVDVLVGRYIFIDTEWGRSKLFYEQSGDPGNVPILFLHTAGSDGRQYHGVMNDSRMLAKYHMTSIDLPGHGRSFPAERQIPGKHWNTEDAYVGCIREVIKALGLSKPVVCGASMAGHVCLAVATRADEVGVGGVIPCQASEHLDMDRQCWDRSPFVNQSIFAPEWVYGMMAPTAPRKNRNLVWHTYSAQAFSIFHGDLDFYFGGWDGRGRIEHIDTRKCPVYMLTGEYDWSNTPEMSRVTAAKIPGAMFAKMTGLGHFPATENPHRFVGYLLEAMKHIVQARG